MSRHAWTSKGQVTIPNHIRHRQGITAGSEIEISARGDSIVVTKAHPRKRAAQSEEEFAAYVERVTGIVDIGMNQMSSWSFCAERTDESDPERTSHDPRKDSATGRLAAGDRGRVHT